jgi:transcriptional regulator with XRE-family HTH domain
MNLQEISKQKGYKVHEIAQQVGIDSSLMSRILAGKRKPTSLQIQKLAVALELSHSDVLTHYLSQEIVQIVQNYPQLAPRILQLAEERISYLLKNTDFESAKPTKKIKTKLAQFSSRNA